jgi:hypothetical protein
MYDHERLRALLYFGFIVLKLFLAVPTLWWCSTSASTAA